MKLNRSLRNGGFAATLVGTRCSPTNKNIFTDTDQKMDERFFFPFGWLAFFAFRDDLEKLLYMKNLNRQTEREGTCYRKNRFT